MASVRAAFSSGVFLGMPNAAMMRLNASVSSSTRWRRRSCRTIPSSATLANSSHCSSQPGLWLERLATIVASDAPKAPMYADTEPPPGAGLSRDVSSANPLTVRSTSRFCFSSPAAITYSIIFSSGLNSLRSDRPNDLMAMSRMSFFGIPAERCCFARK